MIPIFVADPMVVDFTDQFFITGGNRFNAPKKAHRGARCSALGSPKQIRTPSSQSAIGMRCTLSAYMSFLVILAISPGLWF